MSKAETTSLALVLADARITNKSAFTRFQNNTASQVAIIQRTEKENVTRRLFVGLALEMIKETFGHGNGWIEWKEKHVLSQMGESQMHYTMAAAREWVDQTGVKIPDVTALSGGKVWVNIKAGPLKQLAASADKFVGDLTWGELLAREDIRDGTPHLGGTRPHGTKKQKALSAEQLYLFAREQLGSIAMNFDRVILKENVLQYFEAHPDEAIATIEGMETTLKKAKEAAKALQKK